MTGAVIREGRIAILIPTFNGGALLAETVASVARAGLPAGSYEIVVSDNASTDGSVACLAARDAQGAPITVHRNPANLGRVANWNRAVAHAEEMGFSYALFLMVGDLLKDAGIIALRDRMERQGAALGIACYEIVDERLRPLRVARRIRWSGDPAIGMQVGRFVAQSLAIGAMLCGPLGANLYRIDGAARLRFDPGDESHADQLATVLFAQRAQTPIVYLDAPVSRWRRREGRFHGSMTVPQRLAGDLRVMESACRSAQVTPDYAKIRASLMLRATFFMHGDFRAAWAYSRALTSGTRLSWPWLAKLLCRQLYYRTPWRVEA